MNKYDKILERFTGDSDDPMWCEKPFKSGGAVVATDRYILIRIAAEKCGEKYHEQPNQPKLDRTFPAPNCDLLMNVHDMAKKINAVEDEITIPVSGDDAKCPECGGRGTVEWEYESNNGTRYGDFDCPECGGRGYVKHKTFTREERNININGADFKIGNIMRILESIYQFGIETVHVVSLHEYHAMMISVEPGVDIITINTAIK